MVRRHEREVSLPDEVAKDGSGCFRQERQDLRVERSIHKKPHVLVAQESSIHKDGDLARNPPNTPFRSRHENGSELERLSVRLSRAGLVWQGIMDLL